MTRRRDRSSRLPRYAESRYEAELNRVTSPTCATATNLVLRTMPAETRQQPHQIGTKESPPRNRRGTRMGFALRARRGRGAADAIGSSRSTTRVRSRSSRDSKNTATRFDGRHNVAHGQGNKNSSPLQATRGQARALQLTAGFRCAPSNRRFIYSTRNHRCVVTSETADL